MVLMRVLLIVERSQKVDHTGGRVDGEVVGRYTCICGQLVSERQTLV